MDRQITDREVYPAVWITAGVLLTFFLIWKFLFGEPTISVCWIYQNWHIYCPGCGGTRALTALFHGQLLRSIYYHPVVPAVIILAVIYLISQTLWRIRGKRGGVLRYDRRWPGMLIGLVGINCILRNVALLGFGLKL